jgi:PAS domain S-box-containing protein
MENSFPHGIQYLKSLFENNDQADQFREKLMDFFPALIYVYDADKKQLSYANKKLTELLGYSFDEIKTWDNDFLKLVFHDDVDIVKSELDKFNSLPDDTDYYGFNLRLNRKTGDWRHFRAQGVVLKKNETGKPSSLLFIAQDITDQLKSQEEIRAMKEMMDDNENMLQFGSWTWDIKTDKLSWSNGMYEIYGYTREEVNGHLTHAFEQQHIAEKDLAGLQQTIQAAIAQQSKFQHQYRIRRKDGLEAVVLSNGKVVVNDKGDMKIVGNTRDVTEQAIFQEAQLKFRQTQADRETFLAHGSWEVNIDGSNFTCSDGMLQLFGYDPAHREQSALDEDFFFQHIKPEDQVKIRQARQEALSTNGYYTVSFTITTQKGEQKKLETFAKIIRDNQEQALKTYGITRDITQLTEYEKNLEAKIRELNRSNQELEEFAYVASHDLQEPLRKLTTFSERLTAKHADNMDKEVRMYVDRIVSAADNMRTLIDNLLEFSRVTRTTHQYIPTDLNDIIREVQLDLDLGIEEAHASIVISQPLPVIEAIPSQMRQLFTNLLSNSLKFKQPGVPPLVRISATQLEAGQQDLQLPVSGTYYRIDITDNGIGFEQEYAERIFQIFQRLHGKVEYPGSGVGLAICKKIVENHNGRIFAEGKTGVGAVFTILLPQHQ